MPKQPINPVDGPYVNILKNEEIDCAYPISQLQLNDAKIYASREEYINNLPNNLKYMEVGIAWGYYSSLVAMLKNPSKITLIDLYNQDLKCWSWRKFGECKCGGIKHTLDYTPETHEQYIKDKFAQYNVETIKGDSQEILPLIQERDYDYIYLDIVNDRNIIRKALWDSSRLIKINGIIGLNDYLIYDGIIEDKPYGTFQVVNEFLNSHKNWYVDGIALHVLGFYDIYLKRGNNEQDR
jgi:hypothetical protein